MAEARVEVEAAPMMDSGDGDTFSSPDIRDCRYERNCPRLCSTAQWTMTLDDLVFLFVASNASMKRRLEIVLLAIPGVAVYPFHSHGTCAQLPLRFLSCP